MPHEMAHTNIPSHRHSELHRGRSCVARDAKKYPSIRFGSEQIAYKQIRRQGDGERVSKAEKSARECKDAMLSAGKRPAEGNKNNEVKEKS